MRLLIALLLFIGTSLSFGVDLSHSFKADGTTVPSAFRVPGTNIKKTSNLSSAPVAKVAPSKLGPVVSRNNASSSKLGAEGEETSESKTEPANKGPIKKIIDVIKEEIDEAVTSEETSESVFDSSEAELLVLQFNYGRWLLSDAMIGFFKEGRLFIPLGEVMDSVEFAVNVDPEARQAEGWFLAENRRFSLDVARNEVTVEGRKKSFDPGLVLDEPEDIYIESELLGSWFPLEFEFNLSTLLVEVSSEEALPFEQRLKREESQSKLGRVNSRRQKVYPTRKSPYKIIDWPSLDSSYNFSYDNNANTFSANSSTVIGGDLLYHDALVSTSGTRDDPFASLRVRLSREDTEAKLLGPLKVSSYSMGDVFSTQVPLAAGSKSGVGFEMSSFPLLIEQEFDRVNLRGELLEGWEVELYRNETLLNVQNEPNADGRYEFLDVPVLFGRNIIRLIFYGPQGQKREEVKNLSVSGEQLSPGQHFFRFSSLFQDINLFEVGEEEVVLNKGDGKARYTFEYQRGINRLFSLQGNLISLETADGRLNFSSIGVRTGLFNAVTRIDLTNNLTKGGTALEVAVLTNLLNVNVFLEHTRFFDFTSERITASLDPLSSQTSIRLDSNLPRWKLVPRIPVSITADLERTESGVNSINLSNRLSASIDRLSISNTVSASLVRGGNSTPSSTASGSTQVSGELFGLPVRSSMSYLIFPDPVLSSINLDTDYKLTGGYSLNLGVNKQLTGSGTTNYSFGVNRRFSSFAIGVDGSYNDVGTVTLGSSITYSLGREPRKGDWVHSSDRMASSGMVSVHVFLDNNGNKVFDKGDKPLQGVTFRPGGAERRTNSEGILLLTGLSSSRPTNVVLNRNSLEDPFLLPQAEGFLVTARPGSPIKLDFPVSPTGEVDGTAYLIKDGNERGIPGALLQLVNDKQEVLFETKSEFDGFYLLQLVPLGKYWLRISPDQVERLNLKPIEPIEVVLTGDEGFVSSLDLKLEQIKVKKVYDFMKEKGPETKADPAEVVKPEMEESETNTDPVDDVKPETETDLEKPVVPEKEVVPANKTEPEKQLVPDKNITPENKTELEKKTESNMKPKFVKKVATKKRYVAKKRIATKKYWKNFKMNTAVGFAGPK